MKIRRRQRTAELLHEINNIEHFAGFHALQFDHMAIPYRHMHIHNWPRTLTIRYSVQTCTKEDNIKNNFLTWAYNDNWKGQLNSALSKRIKNLSMNTGYSTISLNRLKLDSIELLRTEHLRYWNGLHSKCNKIISNAETWEIIKTRGIKRASRLSEQPAWQWTREKI